MTTATAEATQPENRWQTITQIWNDYRWLYGAVGFVLGLIAFPAMSQIVADLGGLLGDLVPEAVGIMFTVSLIDRLYQQREERRQTEELKARLIGELRSAVNAVAINAAEELRRYGWLTDGTLEGKAFMHANLKGVNLHKANLKNVNLRLANLEDAYLGSANFDGADLFGANLKNANGLMTTFKNANLRHADLRGAFLDFADFTKAVLPDNTLGASLTNTARFTCPEHPQFWMSEIQKLHDLQNDSN